jgi:hypothetical protein
MEAQKTKIKPAKIETTALPKPHFPLFFQFLEHLRYIHFFGIAQTIKLIALQELTTQAVYQGHFTHKIRLN